MPQGFVHSTGFAPELLYPGLAAIWGDTYEQHPKMYDKFHRIKQSTQAFEKEQGMTGFATASVKDQGDSVEFAQTNQTYQKEYVNLTYGLGAIVTREMVEDDKYGFIQTLPKLLALAMMRTEETVATANLNNAFDASVTGADGQSLCSTAHPNGGAASNATQSNRPTTAADLTQTSMEAGIIAIMNYRDEQNQRLNYMPKKLVVSRSDYFNATKILQTEYKTGSADNDINVISSMPIELVVTNYLTDQDAWFLCNGIDNGLTFYERRKADIERDNDKSTQNLAIITTMRFSTGWTDWRDIYGSPGA